MTIEERATSYSEMLYDEYETRLAQDTAYEGYISGATEQREIDIEKACKWLKSYRQETPDGLGYIAGIVNDKTVEEFRKAMEKDTTLNVTMTAVLNQLRSTQRKR